MVVRQYIMLQGESPTYILNEDTQPVIRAIGVSHTQVAKMSFDKIFDLTQLEYFFSFFIIYHTGPCVTGTSPRIITRIIRTMFSRFRFSTYIIYLHHAYGS